MPHFFCRVFPFEIWFVSLSVVICRGEYCIYSPTQIIIFYYNLANILKKYHNAYLAKIKLYLHRIISNYFLSMPDNINFCRILKISIFTLSMEDKFSLWWITMLVVLSMEDKLSLCQIKKHLATCVD